MTESTEDFLDIDPPQGKHAAARTYAKLYVAAFVDNPAGAELLRDWNDRLLKARIPVNATINEYVATEARRAFVQAIHEQIALARSE